MRIYERRNEKGGFSCSYCWEQGHKINDCPTLKANYEQHAKGEAIDFSTHPMVLKYGWNTNLLRRQWEQNQAKAERYYGTTPAAKAKKPRKKPKCGFCGSKSHTRRNCEAMSQFKYLYEQANLAYRKEFYDRIIVDLGFGAGALVEMWDYQGDHKVGIIEMLDPKTIGLGNLATYWGDYKTHIKWNAIIDGRKVPTPTYRSMFNWNLQQSETDLIGKAFSVANDGYSVGSIVSIVSPAPQVMSKEWFDGESEPIDYVMKKRTAGQLFHEFNLLIRRFYPHEDLDNKMISFKKTAGI